MERRRCEMSRPGSRAAGRGRQEHGIEAGGDRREDAGDVARRAQERAEIVAADERARPPSAASVSSGTTIGHTCAVKLRAKPGRTTKLAPTIKASSASDAHHSTDANRRARACRSPSVLSASPAGAVHRERRHAEPDRPRSRRVQQHRERAAELAVRLERHAAQHVAERDAEQEREQHARDRKTTSQKSSHRAWWI